MKNIRLCILALLLTAASTAFPLTLTMPDKVKDSCAHMYKQAGNHRGKVCFAAGAVGLTVVNKVLEKEIDLYVKPFLKSVCTRTYNFFKRLFRR